MKAVICTKYGAPDVLEVQDVPMPTIGEYDILIQNHAASVTRADALMRQGTPKFARLFLGLLRPKKAIIGTGFAGIVTQMGSKVTQFKTGDKVYGETATDFSANAEYVAVNVQNDVIQLMPKNMSFEEAAPLCDGALTSYNFLTRIGELKAGQHVLINGASGALGCAAVQIAKHIGAVVTAVCSHKNAALVKELGADFVIDYNKENFCLHQQRYDLIYDSIGSSSFIKAKKALKPQGQYISPVLSLSLLWSVISTKITGQQKAKFDATGLLEAKQLNQFLTKINTLISSNKLKTILDKTYLIEDIKAAHQYLDTGRKRGNIVLVFEH